MLKGLLKGRHCELGAASLHGPKGVIRVHRPLHRPSGWYLEPFLILEGILHEIESCILHTASHFLSNAGWTVHSMQQDSDASVPLGLLVRPPAQLRPEQGDRPGRELVVAAEAALNAIARQTSASVAQPPPQGLGLDVTLAVRELYGLDPETILRSFD